MKKDVMNRTSAGQIQKKKLVLRRESIRIVDAKDLTLVAGGDGAESVIGYPPDGGPPPLNRG